MATTVLSFSPQKVTVSGTGEHELDFNSLLKDTNGDATIELFSGSEVQINSSGITITSASGSVTTSNPRSVIQIQKGTPIKYKGVAGGEVFQVSIIS